MEQKEIERVTPLIRALYMHQPVMMHPDWECFNDNRPTMVEAHHFEDSQKKRWDKGYLLLRPLSSITDEEAVHVAKMYGWDENVNKDFKERVLQFKIDIPCIAIKGYHHKHMHFVFDYLRQQSFALPYYDSITNTTLTPEQMQEYGIIKLK